MRYLRKAASFHGQLGWEVKRKAPKLTASQETSPKLSQHPIASSRCSTHLGAVDKHSSPFRTLAGLQKVQLTQHTSCPSFSFWWWGTGVPGRRWWSLPLPQRSFQQVTSGQEGTLTCTLSLLGRAVNTNDESSLRECSKQPLLAQALRAAPPPLESLRSLLEFSRAPTVNQS